MLKASKPFFCVCASANIYLTEPVYKLIHSRIAKEEKKKKVWLQRDIEVRESCFSGEIN